MKDYTTREDRMKIPKEVKIPFSVYLLDFIGFCGLMTIIIAGFYVVALI